MASSSACSLLAGAPNIRGQYGGARDAARAEDSHLAGALGQAGVPGLVAYRSRRLRRHSAGTSKAARDTPGRRVAPRPSVTSCRRSPLEPRARFGTWRESGPSHARLRTRSAKARFAPSLKPANFTTHHVAELRVWRRSRSASRAPMSLSPNSPGRQPRLWRRLSEQPVAASSPH